MSRLDDPVGAEADVAIAEMQQSMAQVFGAFAQILGAGEAVERGSEHLGNPQSHFGSPPRHSPPDPFGGVFGRGGFFGPPFGPPFGHDAPPFGRPPPPSDSSSSDRSREVVPGGVGGDLFTELFRGLGGSVGGGMLSGRSVVRSQQTQTYQDEDGARVTKTIVSETVDGHTTTTTTITRPDGTSTSTSSNDGIGGPANVFVPPTSTPALPPGPTVDPADHSWGVSRVHPSTPRESDQGPLGVFRSFINRLLE